MIINLLLTRKSLCTGKEEDQADMLKSVLAQFEFTALVRQYVQDGVAFDTHLHVPEVHQCTGAVVCQREDEGHLFRVNFGIYCSSILHYSCDWYAADIIVFPQRIVRQGRVEGIGLERFVEALQDESTGLTYPALTGVRKQSVQDVERLFGSEVIEFMKYHAEAKILKVVQDWRRAIDERGLDESQTQRFIQDFKAYICQDLMPWYADGVKDFSLLEVNRYSIHDQFLITLALANYYDCCYTHFQTY